MYIYIGPGVLNGSSYISSTFTKRQSRPSISYTTIPSITFRTKGFLEEKEKKKRKNQRSKYGRYR
jgi:hypothetical protein